MLTWEEHEQVIRAKTNSIAARRADQPLFVRTMRPDRRTRIQLLATTGTGAPSLLAIAAHLLIGPDRLAVVDRIGDASARPVQAVQGQCRRECAAAGSPQWRPAPNRAHASARGKS